MNYFLVTFGQVQTPDTRQTDRQTESDAYEPTVQIAQVGSIKVTLMDRFCIMMF